MFSFLNALVAILNLSFTRNFLGDYWEQITMCVCDVNSLSQWLVYYKVVTLYMIPYEVTTIQYGG